MSTENFQLIDSMKMDTSVGKRDKIKIYLQQRAELKNPDQKNEIILGKK